MKKAVNRHIAPQHTIYKTMRAELLWIDLKSMNKAAKMQAYELAHQYLQVFQATSISLS